MLGFMKVVTLEIPSRSMTKEHRALLTFDNNGVLINVDLMGTSEHEVSTTRKAFDKFVNPSLIKALRRWI